MCSWCCTAAEAADCDSRAAARRKAEPRRVVFERNEPLPGMRLGFRADVPGLGRVELTEVGNDDVLVELADAKVFVQGLADDPHTCRALRLACHLPETVGA